MGKEWEEVYVHFTNVSLLRTHISSSLATLGPYYEYRTILNRIERHKICYMLCLNMNGTHLKCRLVQNNNIQPKMIISNLSKLSNEVFPSIYTLIKSK